MRHDAGIIQLRLLSFHAAYTCRHSGACCTAGWVEPDDTGRCRFHDAHPAGGCTTQRRHGHDAIPAACQQFPRVATLSPLGTSVTLSAFCPTAASMLFGDEPFEIVRSAQARPLEGLDARDVMPPLLRPGMLMDWDAVARWEELAVATLSDHREDVDRALATIETASQQVYETWTPEQGGLNEAVASAFADSGISVSPSNCGRAKERSRLRSFNSVEPETPESAAALARYFASHAFACWPMYDGKGIRGAVDWLRTVRATLVDERLSCPDLKEAFRRADLALRHRV